MVHYRVLLDYKLNCGHQTCEEVTTLVQNLDGLTPADGAQIIEDCWNMCTTCTANLCPVKLNSIKRVRCTAYVVDQVMVREYFESAWIPTEQLLPTGEQPGKV